MSITGALSNALTGLTASSRAAQITASNISNAMTPGYGRRALELASRTAGSAGGVTIVGVSRLTDPATIADRRLAQADLAKSTAAKAYFDKLESLTGTPDQTGSLTDLATAFEQSLISAASRPDLTERLDSAVRSAETLAEKFQSISSGIQDMRIAADTEIDAIVTRLNKLLEQVSDLNSQITRFQNAPDDMLALQDSRQLLIDEISGLIPVRVVKRDLGQVALYSTGGTILLDGPPPELEFEPTSLITANQTYDLGLLSGLSLNGKSVDINPDNGAIKHGALAAQFAIRDIYAVDAQAQIDGLARELVERFQDNSLDSTLGANDAGLFTDSGSAFGASDEVGLSGRLSINSLVTTTGAGESWRLRDGLGAVVQGNLGDGSLLNGMSDILGEKRTAVSDAFGSRIASVFDIAAHLHSNVSTGLYEAEQRLTFDANQFSALQEKELGEGVDTDFELQQLLLIEQNYAANARMIQTVDELIQTLLRM